MIELLSLFFALLWLAFLLTANSFMKKQREANRQIVTSLTALQREAEKLNAHLESSNKMQGDLNRAAQWFVDRASAKP